MSGIDPMTHPLTPREKVRKVIIDVMKPKDADITLGRIDTCTDAILTALASGSGDHGELVEVDDEDCETCDGSGEVEARIGVGTDYIPCPDCVSRANKAEKSALLAEVAALRAKAGLADMLGDKLERRTFALVEAERKLAEAVAVIERLGSSEAFDIPCVIDGPLAAEMRARMDYARTFLSKEAPDA